MEKRSFNWKNPAVLTVALAVVIGGVSFAALRSPGSPTTTASTYVAPPTVAISSDKVTTMVDLKALDRSFQQLADEAAPAVVHIRTTGKQTNDLFGGRQEIAGEGSGFIFRPDGYIVTNDHVVGGFDKVTVVLHDGREFAGKVLRAEESDIAVVKIDAKDLPTLRFSDSNTTKVGQLTMAIGAPFGLENTVTYGHVSATGRLNRIPDQMSGSVRNYFDLVQTDASINMGNSGGPLINVDGEVIGINTSIYSTTGQSNGIGFAISSNTARTLAETLIAKGKVTRAYMGVLPENLKEFEQKDLKLTAGAILRQVTSDGPAAAAGLKAGDVIVKVGDHPIVKESDLRLLMFQLEPGTNVPVDYIRDGKKNSTSVRISEAPKQQSQAPMAPDGPGMQMPDVPGFKDGMPQFPDSPKAPNNGKPRLGVQVQDMSDAVRSQFGIPAGEKGAVVVSVEPGSVADRIGMKTGDVIQSIGTAKVASAQEVVDALSTVKRGDTRQISFARFGQGSVSRMSLPASF